jgi:hypothetical protein
MTLRNGVLPAILNLIMIDGSDSIYIVFMLICAWLAVVGLDGGGGGHRARLRA